MGSILTALAPELGRNKAPRPVRTFKFYTLIFWCPSRLGDCVTPALVLWLSDFVLNSAVPGGKSPLTLAVSSAAAAAATAAAAAGAGDFPIWLQLAGLADRGSVPLRVQHCNKVPEWLLHKISIS